MEAVASYDELLAKPGVHGHEVWDAAKKAKPELPTTCKSTSRTSTRSPTTRRSRQGARMRASPKSSTAGTTAARCRLPSGAIRTAGAEQVPRAVPGRLHQRSHRPDPRLVLQPAGDQHDAVRRTEDRSTSDPPTPTARTHRLPASVPQLHRPRPDAGRRRAEDVKSKRNYREPSEIFDRYGADALRWYFFANQPPWTSIRYTEQAIKDSIPEFLLRLWNVYSFFVIYANIDGFDPAAAADRRRRSACDADDVGRSAKAYRPIAERSELDRWILSELNRTAAAVVERMDAYDNYAACEQITEFVDALSQLVRPPQPRPLLGRRQARSPTSSTPTGRSTSACSPPPSSSPRSCRSWPKRCGRIWPWPSSASAAVAKASTCADFPTGDAAADRRTLSARMNLVREIASLGRAARMGAKLKVRQPLAKVEVILADATHQAWLEEHDALIARRAERQAGRVHREGRSVHHLHGAARLQAARPAARQAAAAREDALRRPSGGPARPARSRQAKSRSISDGPSRRSTAKTCKSACKPSPAGRRRRAKAGVVVLSTEFTPALVAEGLARELVHADSRRRRDRSCEYTDRIKFGIVTESAELQGRGRAVRRIHPGRDADGRIEVRSNQRRRPGRGHDWRVCRAAVYARVSGSQ